MGFSAKLHSSGFGLTGIDPVVLDQIHQIWIRRSRTRVSALTVAARRDAEHGSGLTGAGLK
jgi:hypothetical protein